MSGTWHVIEVGLNGYVIESKPGTRELVANQATVAENLRLAQAECDRRNAEAAGPPEGFVFVDAPYVLGDDCCALGWSTEYNSPLWMRGTCVLGTNERWLAPDRRPTREMVAKAWKRCSGGIGSFFRAWGYEP